MSLIIPEVQFDYLDEGARRFLEALRSDSTTERWVIIHAPKFPNAPMPIPGVEVNVIVDPSSAVLMTLCVPQQKIEYRAGSGWVLGGIAVDPYEQAEELEKALRAYLEEGGINLSRTPIGRAIVFTNAAPPADAPCTVPTFNVNDLATARDFMTKVVETIRATRVAPSADVGRGAWPDYRLSAENAIMIMPRLISSTK